MVVCNILHIYRSYWWIKSYNQFGCTACRWFRCEKSYISVSFQSCFSGLNFTNFIQSNIIRLEGAALNLSCFPSIDEAVLSWMHNNNDIMEQNDISFSPPILNHTLTFEKLKASDSGIYTCRVAIDEPVLERNISLTVIPGMNYAINCICICLRCFFMHASNTLIKWTL